MLNVSKLEASLILNDLKKVSTPSAEFIKTLVRIVVANPTIARKSVSEGIELTLEEGTQIDEAIPADQVTYFNLARAIKKTDTSNSGNTKFVSGSYVYTKEKKDGVFGSISKIDDKRNILWTVSLKPVKELNDAPKLEFIGNNT